MFLHQCGISRLKYQWLHIDIILNVHNQTQNAPVLSTEYSSFYLGVRGSEHSNKGTLSQVLLYSFIRELYDHPNDIAQI